MKNHGLNLYLQQGGPAEVTENFRRIQGYFDRAPQVNGFKPLSFSLPEGSTQVKIAHGLSFVPRDVLVTRLLAASGAKLIVHHGLFDRTHIVVSASGTGAMNVRMLVGSFDTNPLFEDALDESETQEFQSKV